MAPALDHLLDIYFERWEEGQVTAQLEVAPGMSLHLYSDIAHSPRTWRLEELELVHEAWPGEGQRSAILGLRAGPTKIGPSPLDDYINAEFDRWTQRET